MVEPAITPMSAPFYNWLHPEPVDMHQDLMALPKSPPEAGRDPFDANQAIPTLIFSDPTGPVMRSVAEGFTVYDKHLISFWAYPLSGGFRHWGLVNGGMARIALRIERLFEPVIGRIAAFRLFVVLERS
jgi:hypothetical protein